MMVGSQLLQHKQTQVPAFAASMAQGHTHFLTGLSTHSGSQSAVILFSASPNRGIFSTKKINAAVK
jgi:hypothetical protein